MKRFLKIVCCFGILNAFGADAMVDDYEVMYQNTSESSTVQKISTIALSSGEVPDEKAMRKVASSGDYVAQYLLAQQAGLKARFAHNGEKDALLKEKALFLSISAIHGRYWKSVEEINGILPTQLNPANYPDFLAVQRLVESIYREL